MSYLLALDQGTTSSRALLFDTDTRVIALAQREFRQHYPRPGWVEHDAGEIRDTQLDVAREAIRTAGIDPEQIAAIGITNQRETTVLWDRRSGEPVAPAIVWQDRRTARTCDRLRQEGHAERITELTGLQLDPYFSGTKLRWLLRGDPELRRRAERGELAFGTIDSWLVWCLTGGRAHVTDASNASRTLLFNLHEGRWDEELLELFEIPAAVLPEVVDSSGVCGTTDPGVLGAALPIAGIAGDQQSALFGQMCVRPGMVKNTYGTGCFLLMTTGAEPTASEHRLLSTVAWRIGGKTTYALEGSVFMGGAVVQWLRDELGMIASADEVEALAASVPDTGGVVFVPAFTGLGAPHWDPYARGALLGMTRGTGRAQVARAALESIAHQVADVVEAMRADAGVDLQEIRVDGGAAANDLLLGIQADLLGAAVIRPTQLETTALGAAYLAGLGAGVWPDVGGLEGRWQHERRFEPSLPGPQRKLQRARWRRALERAANWARHEEGAEEEPPVEP